MLFGSPTLNRFDMSGRRAIVTGAGGLLGREFCRALVDVGAAVYAIDLTLDRLDCLRDVPQIVPVACDVTRADDVVAMVRAIAEEGSIDALVTSAAVDPKVDAAGAVGGGAVPFTRYPEAAWALMLSVNLTGMFLVVREVASVMETQGDDGVGRGAIVTIASTYGLTGPDQRLYRTADGRQLAYKPLDYPTTKAGVIGFTRALATQYMGTDIRANTLTPGGAFADQDPAFVERYASRTVLNRMADPGEYRAAIAFLCSDASSYMTGSNLIIDGGWTAL